MKIKIIRNTVAQGKPVFVGQELDASKEEARLLISLGKAEGVAEKAAPVKAIEKAPETAEAPAPKKGKG